MLVDHARGRDPRREPLVLGRDHSQLPPKTLAKLLDKKSKLDEEHQLLGKLVLERIGLYPQTKGAGFAIFDFTFEGNHSVKGRRPITDQIIAVYLDAKGKVDHLSHES